MWRGEAVCCEGGNERAAAEATSFDVGGSWRSRAGSSIVRCVAALRLGDARARTWGLRPTLSAGAASQLPTAVRRERGVRSIVAPLSYFCAISWNSTRPAISIVP